MKNSFEEQISFLLTGSDFEHLHETLGVTKNKMTRLLRQPKIWTVDYIQVLYQQFREGVNAPLALVYLLHSCEMGYDKVTLRESEYLVKLMHPMIDVKLNLPLEEAEKVIEGSYCLQIATTVQEINTIDHQQNNDE